MDHPLKPPLSVTEVFLKKLSNFVTLKTSTKISTTRCSPCSGERERWGEREREGKGERDKEGERDIEGG